MNLDIIQLSDIRQGTPGITPTEGANLYENCIVALHNSSHSVPVTLHVCGLNTLDYSLLWEDTCVEQRSKKGQQALSPGHRPGYKGMGKFALKGQKPYLIHYASSFGSAKPLPVGTYFMYVR